MDKIFNNKHISIYELHNGDEIQVNKTTGKMIFRTEKPHAMEIYTVYIKNIIEDLRKEGL